MKAVCETIERAAIRHQDVIHSLPRPARHHDIIGAMSAAGLTAEATRDQGFLTSVGRYVGREEACRIAASAGQIRSKTGPADRLFSEDLW